MAAWITHIAINADDADATRAFYSEVFGWDFAAWGPPGFSRAELPAAPEGTIAAVQDRRELVAGERLTGPEVTIGVDDFDGTEQRIVAHGGTIIMERTVIPTVGTLLFAKDPSGNVIGVIAHHADA